MACDAQTLENLGASLGYIKLSEYDLLVALAQIHTNTAGFANAQAAVVQATTKGYAALSDEDLDTCYLATVCSTCDAQAATTAAVGNGYLKLADGDQAATVASRSGNIQVQTLLNSAYSKGYSKLSERMLKEVTIAGACTANCTAKQVLASAISDGYLKLSEKALADCILLSSCANFPLSDPTLIGWWKADSLSLTDGTSVSSWNDSSNSGFTLSQLTALHQPTFKVNQKNGLPAVLFDPTSAQYMTCSMPSNTKPFTVAAVIMSNQFSSRASTVFGSNASGDLQWYTNTTGTGLFADAQDVVLITHPAETFTNNNWYIIIMTYDGSGNWQMVVNGSVLSGTNNVSLTGGSTTSVGAKGSTTGVAMQGYIGELLKFSSVVNTTTIDTYLNGRWAVH